MTFYIIWCCETWQALLAVPPTCPQFEDHQNPVTSKPVVFPTKCLWKSTPTTGRISSSRRLLSSPTSCHVSMIYFGCNFSHSGFTLKIQYWAYKVSKSWPLAWCPENHKGNLCQSYLVLSNLWDVRDYRLKSSLLHLWKLYVPSSEIRPHSSLSAPCILPVNWLLEVRPLLFFFLSLLSLLAYLPLVPDMLKLFVSNHRNGHRI